MAAGLFPLYARAPAKNEVGRRGPVVGCGLILRLVMGQNKIRTDKPFGPPPWSSLRALPIALAAVIAYGCNSGLGPNWPYSILPNRDVAAFHKKNYAMSSSLRQLHHHYDCKFTFSEASIVHAFILPSLSV